MTKYKVISIGRYTHHTTMPTMCGIFNTLKEAEAYCKGFKHTIAGTISYETPYVTYYISEIKA